MNDWKSSEQRLREALSRCGTGIDPADVAVVLDTLATLRRGLAGAEDDCRALGEWGEGMQKALRRLLDCPGLAPKDAALNARCSAFLGQPDVHEDGCHLDAARKALDSIPERRALKEEG